MLASSEARSARNARRRPIAELERIIAARTAAPTLALDATFSLIAEIKGRSPAEGQLAQRASLDRPRQAQAYAAGGAAAVSVLTEPARFDGALDHLETVAEALQAGSVPAMRKDFLCSEYQLYEAAAHGAGGVLLITAMLDDATLRAMLDRAAALNLFVLLECFDIDDVKRSCALLELASVQSLRDRAAFMLGVNTRNLRTLAVDTDRLAALAAHLPTREVVCIAESGLTEPDDAARALDMGYRGALIGTALMRSASPEAAVRAFVQRGRGA